MIVGAEMGRGARGESEESGVSEGEEEEVVGDEVEGDRVKMETDRNVKKVTISPIKKKFTLIKQLVRRQTTNKK